MSKRTSQTVQILQAALDIERAKNAKLQAGIDEIKSHVAAVQCLGSEYTRVHAEFQAAINKLESTQRDLKIENTNLRFDLQIAQARLARAQGLADLATRVEQAKN